MMQDERDKLPKLTNQEIDEWVRSLRSQSFAICDITLGCSNPATWAVHFHGCDFYIGCELHVNDWVGELLRSISADGYMHCTDCGHIFEQLSTAVKSWKI